jgi:hypothetical protein
VFDVVRAEVPVNLMMFLKEKDDITIAVKRIE